MYETILIAQVIATVILVLGMAGRLVVDSRRCLDESMRLSDQARERIAQIERVRDACKPLRRVSVTSAVVERPQPQPFENYEPGSWK